MRIVAGAWRGRALQAPPGDTTRPTADRVRQALFDMLLHAPWGGRDAVEGARVLDVFAGTGALGLEALSRGAAFATFIEQDRAALAALRANIATLGAAGRTPPCWPAMHWPPRRRPPRATRRARWSSSIRRMGADLVPRALATPDGARMDRARRPDRRRDGADRAAVARRSAGRAPARGGADQHLANLGARLVAPAGRCRPAPLCVRRWW